MALDDSAVLVPGEGHFYLGAVGATKPTGTADPGLDFTEVGHTSYDSPLTIAREGGESTVLRSWQSSAVRTRVEPVTYRLSFGLLQHDEPSLKLYYGGGQVNATTTEFEVPKTPVPQAHSLFVRIVDGANVWAKYFPKVDIIGSDSVEEDPENMSSLPVTATLLGDDSLSYLFTIAGPGIIS